MSNEDIQIRNNALESIEELANTLQNYIWDSGLDLTPKHDSVISALITQIQTESKEARGKEDKLERPEPSAHYIG